MSIKTTSTYDDEIDLRAVLQVVWRARLPILIIMLFAAIITFTVSAWLLPEKFSASAYVSIGRPLVEFSAPDGSLSLTSVVPDIKALPELLKTSAIFEKVMSDERVASLLPSNTIRLPGQMSVTAVGTSQLRLDVTETDSQLAIMMAKVWAENAVIWINYNYGIETYADALDGKITRSQEDYQNAQAAMENFLVQDPTPALTNQLTAKNEIYTCLEKKISSSNLILQRLDELDANLVQSDSLFSLSDALLLASIEQDVDTLESCSDQVTVLQSTSPIMFDNVSVSEGKQVIDGLRKSLRLRIEEAEAQQDALENQIPALTVEIDRLNYQRSEYDRQRNQTLGIYQELTLQKSVMQIVLHQSGGVAAISADAVNSKPVSLSPVISAAVAAVVGLLLGMLGALGVDWLGKTRKNA